jgi:plasmid stabilization system protein ParE
MLVKWSLRAQADFRAFYESALEQDPTYALNIVEALDAAITRLLEFPGLGTPVGSAGHRKWRIKKAPFLIIYAIESDSLQVLRVYHERQDRDASE